MSSHTPRSAKMRRIKASATRHLYVMTIAILLHSIVPAAGYGSGGPVSTCTFLYPKHGVAPQTNPSPYTFTTNVTSYSPSDVIELTFGSPSGLKMEGIQASVRRQTGDTEELLGSFINVPSYLQTFSWYPHTSGEQNCVTHNQELEITSLTLYWQAPSFSAGNLIIYVSFVEDYDVFWVMENSVSLTATEPSDNPVFLAEATVGYSTIDTDKCGSTHGCFYYPRDCSGPNCRFIITYIIDEPSMSADIEMFGDAEGYVSIGFSDDKIMTEDHVYVCIQSGDIYRVQHAHNPEYYTARDRIIGVTNITVGRDGDNIYCKFTRPLVQDISIYGRPFTFDMRDSMYLMLAWGSIAIGSDGAPNHHYELPVVSDGKIDYTVPAINTGRSLNVPLVVHASFGIISRMALAGMAIIIARHFRFPFRKRVLGRALWEQLHIGLNFVTLGLMVIAVIIMFAVLGAWSEYATVHAVIGLVVTALMILLIVSGFVAPKRSSQWRFYFDWGHRLTGVLVFFLSGWLLNTGLTVYVTMGMLDYCNLYTPCINTVAVTGNGHKIQIVCCILGFDVSLIEHQLRSRELIILIVWMFFHIIWDVIFELLKCSQERQKAKEKEAQKTAPKEMSVTTAPESAPKKKRSYRMEYLFLAIYVAVNILFTVLSMFYLCTT